MIVHLETPVHLLLLNGPAFPFFFLFFFLFFFCFFSFLCLWNFCQFSGLFLASNPLFCIYSHNPGLLFPVSDGAISSSERLIFLSLS